LAVRGAAVKIAAVIAGATVLGAIATAWGLASRGSVTALAQVPAATSSALAWGAGFLAAVAGSVHAFREDRARGVRALLGSRGASAADYALARVLGLGLVLAAIVGGGTIVGGGAAILATGRVGSAAQAVAWLVASLVFAIGYAAVLAPLALALLGGRSRGGGYLALLTFVVVPELLLSRTSSLVPEGWGDLLSLPSALSALRASIAPDLDAMKLARAALVVAAFAALAFLFVRAEIARSDASHEAAP
jgi:hypothetical protein